MGAGNPEVLAPNSCDFLRKLRWGAAVDKVEGSRLPTEGLGVEPLEEV